MTFAQKCAIEIADFNRGGDPPDIYVSQTGKEGFGGVLVEVVDDYIMFKKKTTDDPKTNRSNSPYEANGMVAIQHIKAYTVHPWGFAIRI
jgi:hypothetical protein